MKKVGNLEERKDVKGPSPDMLGGKRKSGEAFFESPDFFVQFLLSRECFLR